MGACLYVTWVRRYPRPSAAQRSLLAVFRVLRTVWPLFSATLALRLPPVSVCVCLRGPAVKGEKGVLQVFPQLHPS